MTGSNTKGKTTALSIVAGCYLVSITMAWWLAPTDNLLISTFTADLLCTAMVFVFTWIFRNTSIYDPYWSVIPVAMAGWVASEYGKVEVRTMVILGLVVLWGSRLTWNWVRRWEGLHDIDWRYRMYEEKMGKWFWPFSLVGLQLLPTLIVYLAFLPVLFAIVEPTHPFGILGLCGGLVALGGIVLETIADEELWKMKRGKIHVLGDRGVWRWWRFPNYVGEVLFWWGLYFIGLEASAAHGWMIVGPVVMTLLFHFVSMPLMEKRHAIRRPAQYERLMQRPKWVPAIFFPKSRV